MLLLASAAEFYRSRGLRRFVHTGNERLPANHVTIPTCMSAVYLRPPQAERARAQPARLAMLAILLLAFALRAYRLDFQSLWSDEGISLLRASQSLPEMMRNMPVEHTPGYFVLLHGWLALAGTQRRGSALAVAAAQRPGGSADFSPGAVLGFAAGDAAAGCSRGSAAAGHERLPSLVCPRGAHVCLAAGRCPRLLPGAVAGSGTPRPPRQLVGSALRPFHRGPCLPSLCSAHFCRWRRRSLPWAG